MKNCRSYIVHNTPTRCVGVMSNPYAQSAHSAAAEPQTAVSCELGGTRDWYWWLPVWLASGDKKKAWILSSLMSRGSLWNILDCSPMYMPMHRQLGLAQLRSAQPSSAQPSPSIAGPAQ